MFKILCSYSDNGDTQRRPAIYRLQVQRNDVKANSMFFTQQLFFGKTTYTSRLTSSCNTAHTQPPLTNTTYDVGAAYVTSLVCVTVSYRPESKTICFTGTDLLWWPPCRPHRAFGAKRMPTAVSRSILKLLSRDGKTVRCHVRVSWVWCVCFPSMEIRRKSWKALIRYLSLRQ